MMEHLENLSFLGNEGEIEGAKCKIVRLYFSYYIFLVIREIVHISDMFQNFESSHFFSLDFAFNFGKKEKMRHVA